MALGLGKYDAECTRIMEEQHALGVIVIVFQGDKGNGFSCQGIPEVISSIPQVLKSVAEQIEGSKV